MFQVGSIGLIKAIDKFDLNYDVRFSTYAVPMISGEIKRFLRDDGMIKVSRSVKENGWKIRQAAERLGRYEDAHGRLLARQEELAGRMEALKAQGKQKTAQFRELFAEKLTIQNTLTLWETYGIH